MLSPHLNQRLSHLVNHTKRRFVGQKLSLLLLPLMMIAALVYWLSGSSIAGLASIGIPLIVAIILLLRSKAYQEINRQTLLQHLNRTFTACEESAELVLCQDESLSVLQKLQKHRVLPVVSQLLSTNLETALPQYPIMRNVMLIAGLAVLFVLIEYRHLYIDKASTYTQSTQENVKPSKKNQPSVSLVNIALSPPAYTRIPPSKLTEWDIEVLAGTVVTWQLKVSNIEESAKLFIEIGEQTKIELQPQAPNLFVATSLVEHTALYSVNLYTDTQKSVLGSLHTLTVSQDKKPTIKFIVPTKTITEIPKSGTPQLESIVQIGDDFGLNKVEILASIASGSGEAVKFRDQTFHFDFDKSVDQQQHFYKNWDLSALGMQPGDELYFSIRAWDNRATAPQQSRSASKIVRWLEDEQQAVLADGILIDFMPEYFKSQRQIIIETQQLIADKDDLTPEQFEQTSRGLGNAQSFLKQKYGQFLGDEFETGTLHTMEAGPDLHHLEHDDHDEEEGHDQHAEENEEEHTQPEEHHHHEPSPEPEDKSGYQQIIEQFGHNHGEADDGNFIKKGIPSPKLLMKRAIGNMWQAELHLHLSQPERALPFENKALDLLNRAKKAERVYVKRLGFEPPPVSEKRRYQGDLTDILSYERQEQHIPQKDVTQAFSKLMQILYQQQENGKNVQVDKQLSAVLQQVKTYFSEQLDEQPENIAFIATLQNIKQSGQLPLPDCKNCLNELRNKLWQLIPAPVAVPRQKRTGYANQNATLHSYAQFIQQPSVEAKP